MMIKRIAEGEVLPPFYGVAWFEWQSRRVVCLPVPLNVAASVLRSCWIFLRHGHMAVPSSARDAYAQGLRDAMIKEQIAAVVLDIAPTAANEHIDPMKLAQEAIDAAQGAANKSERAFIMASHIKAAKEVALAGAA